VKPNQINAQDQSTVKRLQSEIVYLKNILSMRNKSVIAREDVYLKLQQLEIENKKLKASNISAHELQEIIQENQKIKLLLKQIRDQNEPQTEKDTLDNFLQHNNQDNLSQTNRHLSTQNSQNSSNLKYGQGFLFQQRNKGAVPQSQKPAYIQLQNKNVYVNKGDNYNVNMRKRALERIANLDKLQTKNEQNLAS